MAVGVATALLDLGWGVDAALRQPEVGQAGQALRWPFSACQATIGAWKGASNKTWITIAA